MYVTEEKGWVVDSECDIHTDCLVYASSLVPDVIGQSPVIHRSELSLSRRQKN